MSPTVHMRPSSHDVPHAGDLQPDEHRGGAVGPQDISAPRFPHDVGANVWVRKLEMETREVCSWQKNQHGSCPPSPAPADEPSAPPTSAHAQVATSVGSLSITSATATCGNATIPLRIAAPRSIARDSLMPS